MPSRRTAGGIAVIALVLFIALFWAFGSPRADAQAVASPARHARITTRFESPDEPPLAPATPPLRTPRSDAHEAYAQAAGFGQIACPVPSTLRDSRTLHPLQDAHVTDGWLRAVVPPGDGSAMMTGARSMWGTPPEGVVR